MHYCPEQYSWTIHPIFVKQLDLLHFNINNPYNAPNTDGIDPERAAKYRTSSAPHILCG